VIKKLDFKPSDIAKLYKDQASGYSSFANDSFSWRYLEKPLLDDVLLSVLTKKIKVLDAGCGMGRTLKYLLDKKIPKENIIGVDISDEMLVIARKNVPGVKTIKSDLTKLEIKDKFDLITCTHVLHYLGEKDFLTTLKNFYKLLKPGGTLFFVITHPVRTTRHNLSEYFKRDWIVDHTPWGTTSPLFLRPVCDIVNETIKAGFTIKSLEEPDVSLVAKKSDLVNYLKYSCCPSRVAVVAVK
jgi:ubiquinone/menaquinone biosynthesis C-methylase UbiE